MCETCWFKRKQVLFRCCDLGGWWTPLSEPVSSFCPGNSPAVLKKTKTKASVQRSCSVLKYRLWEPAGSCRGLSPHLGPLACSQLLSFQAPSWILRAEPTRPWAMRLLEPQGHMPMTRWARESERGSLLKAKGHLGAEAMGHGAKALCESSQRASLFPWDYLSLGMGWTRCFLKMTSQLPKLLCTLSVSTSQPILSFPTSDRQVSLVQYLPLCHVDLYGPCACLPLEPPPVWDWSGVVFFPLSDRLTSLLFSQCESYHLGHWERLPGTPKVCFTVT